MWCHVVTACDVLRYDTFGSEWILQCVWNVCCSLDLWETLQAPWWWSTNTTQQVWTPRQCPTRKCENYHYISLNMPVEGTGNSNVLDSLKHCWAVALGHRCHGCQIWSDRPLVPSQPWTRKFQTCLIPLEIRGQSFMVPSDMQVKIWSKSAMNWKSFSD